MKTAFVFPGQGSQVIGMLSTMSDKYPSIQQTFAEGSEALGYDLWGLCQNGPLEKLGQTEFTQPALLTAGVAIWRVWQSENGFSPDVMAGHSLGEYTALCCAGSIDFQEAVALVQDRGRYMQSAVPSGEGAMAAIIGLEDDAVIKACLEASENGIIQAVNFNAPGQVVIAGNQQAITKSENIFKQAGAKRVLPLPVSIPAHSSLMTPAAEQLKERIASVTIAMPDIPVIHNCNLEIAKDVNEIRKNLVTQLDSPVLWVKSVEKMVSDFNVEKIIESGPGKVLSGMVKRINRQVATVSIDTPESMGIELA